VVTPQGSFGGQITGTSETVPPYITAIKLTNGGDIGYIDDNDTIGITFSEPINPKTINTSLNAGDYVTLVPYSQTGGVSVSAAGVVTVNGMAEFDMGSVDTNTNFAVNLALDASATVLTVTLADGFNAYISANRVGTTYASQTGGTVKDANGNKMVQKSEAVIPTGAFGRPN
jgi:hypothetical protein